jgi:hypothetical protein
LYIANVDPKLSIDKGKNLNEMNSSEIGEIMRQYQNEYFEGLINNVFLEYLKLHEFVEFVSKGK